MATNAGTPAERPQTELVRRRYDRAALTYDLTDLPMRLISGRLRRELWSMAQGPDVLEVGVGTGANMRHWPPGVHVVGVDISPKMLARARRRAARMGIEADLREMDAERLQFPDDSFDTVVTTFVFCSVPDPVQGLREIRRVLKRDGRALLLEHVRLDIPVVGTMMDLLNPVAVRMTGANINRRTVQNVERAGLTVEEVRNKLGGLIRLIVARK